MKLERALLRWLMLATIATAACASSPEPQFYTLYPQSGSAAASEPLEVEIRRPGLPGYLDRPQIVRREQPGQLEFSGAARWGSPLEDMVASILTQNLSQRLPNARVYAEAGAISSEPDALVEVEIQSFELTERGSVELIALVALHWPKTTAAARLERYTLRRELKNRSTGHLVAQMSELLAELSDSVTRSLRDGPPSADAPPP